MLHNTREDLDKEMDRLLTLEKQCKKSMVKTNSKQLLHLLGSLERQKKMVSEEMRYAI